MKAKNLRQKSIEELNKDLIERKEKIQKIKFDLATKKNKNHREIRQIKKEIAKILTVISEKKFLTDNKE